LNLRTLSALVLVSRGRVIADPVANAVIEWSGIVQRAIHGPATPPSAGASEILHTMVHLAVYDAVVAVDGGSRPFAARIAAKPGAEVRAAVATAAYLTVRPCIAGADLTTLDQAYATYFAGLPTGDGVTDGVRVGQQAAAAMLALRANDALPNMSQPADVNVGAIKPFTLEHAAVFRPDGPNALDSRTYARDVAEARDMDVAASTLRSAEQTDIAWFWAENPYVHWNRNLMALAQSKELSVRDIARLFAIVHTAASDAIIAGEYPSGQGSWSTAVIASVAAFFGTLHVDWTLTTSKAAVPALVKTERRYRNLLELLAEIGNARVWGGLHRRHALRDGALIGGRVAAHVQWHHFQPTR